MTESLERYCVIGAGPSGLAMAAAFKRLGVSFDHFERHSDLGGLWDTSNPGTPMYDSAHFISSKTLSGFPGFPMPEHFPDYPRHDQILEYLRAFADAHQLRAGISFCHSVDQVLPWEGGADVIVNGKRRSYRGVVCASGINWDPIVPDFSGDFAGEIRHAATYSSPKELEGKRVLIVGLGNSGADIACDAARVAKSTTVSVRRGYHFLPKHLFGKPADVFSKDGPHLPLWLETLLFGWIQRLLIGDTSKLGMPNPGHKVLQSHPLMNDQLLHHLRHGDARLEGDIERFQDDKVVFKNGNHLAVDLVLLATGFSRRIVYVDENLHDGGSWAANHFLTCFNRTYDSLLTLGFVELNGALYPHVGRLAELIARVADAQLREPDAALRFRSWMRTTQFDLSGGRQLIDSPRHAHYCDDHALYQLTARAFKKMGWQVPC